jgi:hypothetical protein
MVIRICFSRPETLPHPPGRGRDAGPAPSLGAARSRLASVGLGWSIWRTGGGCQGEVWTGFWRSTASATARGRRECTCGRPRREETEKRWKNAKQGSWRVQAFRSFSQLVCSDLGVPGTPQRRLSMAVDIFGSILAFVLFSSGIVHGSLQPRRGSSGATCRRRLGAAWARCGRRHDSDGLVTLYLFGARALLDVGGHVIARG